MKSFTSVRPGAPPKGRRGGSRPPPLDHTRREVVWLALLLPLRRQLPLTELDAVAPPQSSVLHRAFTPPAGPPGTFSQPSCLLVRRPSWSVTAARAPWEALESLLVRNKKVQVDVYEIVLQESLLYMKLYISLVVCKEKNIYIPLLSIKLLFICFPCFCSYWFQLPECHHNVFQT
jgi:hypothetical protein